MILRIVIRTSTFATNEVERETESEDPISAQLYTNTEAVGK
jgi:hypothetical protein